MGISALFHVYGLGPGLLGTLMSGASMVLQDEGSAAATLGAVQAHGATVHFGIPTLFVAELDELKERPRDLSSLRLAVVAGAPVNDNLVIELADALGVPVVTGYSLTEPTARTASGNEPV